MEHCSSGVIQHIMRHTAAAEQNVRHSTAAVRHIRVQQAAESSRAAQHSTAHQHSGGVKKHNNTQRPSKTRKIMDNPARDQPMVMVVVSSSKGSSGKTCSSGKGTADSIDSTAE